MKTHKIKGKDYSEETIQNALEAYIKAEPEPEYVPEHLDYGLDSDGNPCMAVRLPNEGMKDCRMDCVCSGHPFGNPYPSYHVHTKMGNLANDLKQWAEDCKDSKRTEDAETGFSKHVFINGQQIAILGTNLLPAATIAYANAIKQVAYTAMRKEGKL